MRRRASLNTQYAHASQRAIAKTTEMRTMKSHVEDEKKSFTDWNGSSAAASKVHCGNALLPT